MNTLALLIGALCVFALGYRFYSAFLAARVLVLDDSRITPAHTCKDGQSFMPSPRWCSLATTLPPLPEPVP